MAARRSVRELAVELNALAQEVVTSVRALVDDGRGSPQAVETAALAGLAGSAEALQELGFMLEAAQNSHDDTEAISEAIEDAERKRAFFQGCTMRRSAFVPPHLDDAAPLAETAESVARSVAGSRDVDQLVEAYKATEALEGQVVELRGSAKSGTAPEPRVLDLPRARVLVARRAIGAWLVALDEDDD